MKFNKKSLTISICLFLLGTISNPVMASENAVSNSNNKLENLSYNDFQKISQNKSNKTTLSKSKNDTAISINDIKNNKKIIPFDDSILQNKIDLQSQNNKNGQVHNIAKPKPNLQINKSVTSQDADATNTAPVAVLDPYILNPDSLRDGMITTNTQIAWIWSDTDADGDEILNRYLDGFPTAYLLGSLDGNKGFVTQFKNPGSFDLYYQVMDTKGALSNIVGYNINVVPVEDYQVFQGNFTSSTDIKTFNVSIDFTKMDTAAICLVETGKTDMNLDIADSSGNKLTTISAYGHSWYFVNKPSADAGVCNYTLTLTPKSQSFNSTYNTYRVMVGNKTDVEPMISGVENALMLDKYTDANKNQFYDLFTPNRDEEWFKFTSDGTTVVTLLNNHPQLRFQIRDVNSLEVLFDTNDPNNSSAHKTKFATPYDYAEKARLATTIGQDYYLVLYSPTLITTAPILEDPINLTVGEPRMSFNYETFYSNNSITATTTSFSSSAFINVSGLPTTAVVGEANVRTNTSGVHMSDINYWRTKAPTESSWRTSGQCYPSIDYNYVPNSTYNLPVNGTWQFSFKAGVKTTTMIPGLNFQYYYELGD